MTDQQGTPSSPSMPIDETGKNVQSGSSVPEQRHLWLCPAQSGDLCGCGADDDEQAPSIAVTPVTKPPAPKRRLSAEERLIRELDKYLAKERIPSLASSERGSLLDMREWLAARAPGWAEAHGHIWYAQCTQMCPPSVTECLASAAVLDDAARLLDDDETAQTLTRMADQWRAQATPSSAHTDES